jgi:hypothetical protein
MSEKEFLLNAHLIVRLSESEIWPDGDGPEHPTAEDVCALIEACGGIAAVIREWNMGDHVEWFVAGATAAGGNDDQ